MLAAPLKQPGEEMEREEEVGDDGVGERFPVEEGGSPKFVSGTRRVYLGSAEALSDGSFVLPVVIDEMENVLSGQIELSFDKGVFKAIEAVKSDLTEEYLFASNIYEDKVKMSFAGAESRPGPGCIATVRFERLGVAAGDIQGIKLEKVQLNEGAISVVLGASGQEASGVPTAYRLFQNFPNPFNPITELRYQLPEASEVRLSVYNLLGQEVQRLVDGKMAAGVHSAQWDGRDDSGRPLASGVYLCRFRAGDFTQTKRIVLLR